MKFEKFESQFPANSFIRLKDGDKVIGIFRGEPKIFKDHWVGNRSELCKGEGCKNCENGKPRFRFHINFLIRGTSVGVWEAKIFAGGYKFYKTLSQLNEEYALEETIVSISRQGSDTSTIYGVLPIKDYQVTPEREALIKEAGLIELDAPLPAKEGSDFHHDDEQIHF